MIGLDATRPSFILLWANVICFYVANAEELKRVLRKNNFILHPAILSLHYIPSFTLHLYFMSSSRRNLFQSSLSSCHHQEETHSGLLGHRMSSSRRSLFQSSLSSGHHQEETYSGLLGRRMSSSRRSLFQSSWSSYVIIKKKTIPVFLVIMKMNDILFL